MGLDRAKYVITAAAPISKQTLEYFQSINIPLMEVYGCSESTGCLTLNTPKESRITSIGKCLPVNEYDIGNKDEDGSGEVRFVMFYLLPVFYLLFYCKFSVQADFGPTDWRLLSHFLVTHLTHRIS